MEECKDCRKLISGIGFCDHCMRALCFICAHEVKRGDGKVAVLCREHATQDIADSVQAPRYNQTLGEALRG